MKLLGQIGVIRGEHLRSLDGNRRSFRYDDEPDRRPARREHLHRDPGHAHLYESTLEDVTPPAPLPLVGGRYQLHRRLGSAGAQGDVYQALDTFEGDIVAIKLLSSVPAGGVWQEAQILRRLVDNHILPIRNADHDAGQPYLVTELATHGSLDSLVAATGSCGLDVDHVVRLVRQACMGVARAHDLRLLHNDLKPGNLFLNAEGECLVGDFGFASLIPAGTTVTRAPGFTPETVAPEIAADPTNPHASVRSDVYSLGATAYILLSARPPLDLSGAASLQEKLAIVATQMPPRLWDVAPHVPRSVQTAVETAMNRNPGLRYPRAVHFAHALGARRTATRIWRRTDEHPMHIGCWRGEPRAAGSTVVLCLEQGSTSTRVQVSAQHAGSGNRVRRAARSGPLRNWGATVRSAMNAVG